VSYKPVNVCIYCRKDDRPLSREHIIPYSLNGEIVLPAASCEDCSRITSEFEREVARAGFGIFRAQNGVRSRKKTNPLDNEVKITGETFAGGTVDLTAKAGAVAISCAVLRMPAPGILLGNAANAEGSISMELPEKMNPGLRSLRERLGLFKIYSSVLSFPMNATMRLLEKIAHAYAVAEYGIDGFSPVLVSHILYGPNEHVAQWHYVGEHIPPARQAEKPLQIREVELNSQRWLVVDISLHFNSKIPMYQVFAGTLPNTKDNETGIATQGVYVAEQSGTCGPFGALMGHNSPRSIPKGRATVS
jgi:hypothetical protein